MDFLDLCEQVADYDRLERDLLVRQREAHDDGDRQQYAQVSDELESITIEKRLTLLKVLDWPGCHAG